MPKQLNHSETVNSSLANPIVVVCDGVAMPANIGMIFRVSEAMGVKQLFLCGNDADLRNKKLRRVARSAEHGLEIALACDIFVCLKELKDDGYQIVALEITDQSVDLRHFSFLQNGKYAVVVGAENYGVSVCALEQSDVAVSVPMFGTNSSMNVVTSLSMLLFEYVRQVSL